MSPFRTDPSLEQLVSQINRADQPSPSETGPSETGSDAGRARTDDDLVAVARRPIVIEGEALAPLLLEMIEREASDLHLVHGEPPVLRVHGRLVKTGGAALTGTVIGQLFTAHLIPRAQRQMAERGAADFSVRLGGDGDDGDDGESGIGARGGSRFRVNLHRQRGQMAASVRALPHRIPTLGELGLPAGLADLILPNRGLVLVCGATGAGKSSTLAALVGEINRRRAAHVLTIEDPIEYEHANQKAIIQQVEVGIDTPDFNTALTASLRQDPDVILVGEMRDIDTMATALTAAETGHLILSTLHTNDVSQAINRIVDVFPPVRQGQIRQQLALSLNAILCQQLIPRHDGTGRVPAIELLTATYPVRNHIRLDKLQSLYTEITLGKRHGMVTMETSLARLVQEDVISYEEASVRAPRREELDSLLGRRG